MSRILKLVAGLSLLCLIGVIFFGLWGSGQKAPSEPAQDELVNLDGVPEQLSNARRFRVVVADVDFAVGFGRPGFEWPEGLDLADRVESVGEQTGLYHADIVVLYDVALDGARFVDLNPLRTIAAEAHTHYYAWVPTWNRRHSLWPFGLGQWSGRFSSGVAVLSTYPIEIVSGGSHGRDHIDDWAQRLWGPTDGSLEVTLTTGPDQTLRVRVDDFLWTGAEPTSPFEFDPDELTLHVQRTTDGDADLGGPALTTEPDHLHASFSEHFTVLRSLNHTRYDDSLTSPILFAEVSVRSEESSNPRGTPTPSGASADDESDDD